ncbi:SRPBCC family protein [Phycicoccus sp. M110.8]|uniref:SRPBCC family protein n=1 Tax=Phycicoccus sp. M110.8 TaxID=3075433 RepID=UPI0028FD6A25|nr:SRPBCC family protein [Phycicoccus sp. M110.8]MDU0313120.1 SRPBCC family protein [Phycicoccus sp. M110.8]
MRTVEVRVWIDRPVEEVYAYTVDLDRWPQWRSDVVGGELLTEGPMRVGSQARGLALVLGRTVPIDVEVTVLQPGSAFGYRPTRGPLRTNNLYTFESQQGGTLVVLTDEIRLKGVFRLFQPVMPAFVRSGYRKNLANLKATLEAEPVQRGARGE